MDLSWNEISHINDTYFHSCKKSRNIFIHHNKLLQIPNFKYISKTICFLSLEASNISNVIPIYGICFPRLQTLEPGSNQIQSFCFPTVYFAPSADNVGLRSNYLQIIYFPLAHSPSTHKVHINLGHNPGYCNQCTPETHHNVMTCFDWLSVAGMICANPPAAQGLTPKKQVGYCTSIYTWQNWWNTPEQGRTWWHRHRETFPR